MIFVTILIALVIGVVFGLKYLNRDYVVLALCRRVKTRDGSPVENNVAIAQGKTIFGNTFDFIAMNAEQLFYHSREQFAELKRSYIEYILFTPIYNIIDAADAELVLTDTSLITKGFVYKYLNPFLGTGLLTSTDKKWHARRKLLTPAFHFNILQQFEEIFKKESAKCIAIIERQIEDATKRGAISLNEIIPRFTLNGICETALGVSLDERLDGDEYRQNIKNIDESFVKRVTNPLLQDDRINNIFGNGKQDEKSIKILHNFSSNIIKKRRILFTQSLQNGDTEKSNADEDFHLMFKKQRYAMLDTLLHAERDDLIDHEGICEEVDTFMFEGFDTTSMNLIFALMNLSLYSEMQQRCYEEINEFIDDDLSNLDISQLNQLKYLDYFVKETQRLYPSVPLILRECVQDTALANNLILPKNTQIAVHIFDIHRNSKYFDDPEEFRPERHMPQNMDQRHPFAFIPFSAGQRNCIGQKFAMLEVKTLLVYILKKFELQPMTDPKSFRFMAGIIIRSHSDVKVKFVKRGQNKINK